MIVAFKGNRQRSTMLRKSPEHTAAHSVCIPVVSPCSSLARELILAATNLIHSRKSLTLTQISINCSIFVHADLVLVA